MGKLKINNNLFLGKAEYNRFQEFLDKLGNKRLFLADTSSFGILENVLFPELGSNQQKDTNLYVEKAGTPYDELSVNRGVAVDRFGNLIVNKEPKRIQIPNDRAWYWLKIKYKGDNLEEGNVTIDQFGNVTGVGTEFIEILRGQPNYPSKIRFQNSQNGNGADYEVVKVIDNENCVISGDFNPESNLKFSVVGTFTPGALIPEEDKNIFVYDSCEIELVPETVFNTPPTLATNEEFLLARTRNNGVDLSLEDQRTQWYRSVAKQYLKNIDRAAENPLIGVESVQYDVQTNPRNENIVNVGFGFRFNSYTIDTAAKKVSILIGQGGKYKDTSYFTAGDFNGWRLYTRNGRWNTIIDSQKTGTQIILTLDVLNKDDFNPIINFVQPQLNQQEVAVARRVSEELFIAPPYESIELRVRRDGAIDDTDDVNSNNNSTEAFPYPLLEEKFEFPINTAKATFKVPAIPPMGSQEVGLSAVAQASSKYKYNVTYRYKIFNEYTRWKPFPSDSVGYYDEDSFDIYGNLKQEQQDRTRVPYSGHESNGFLAVKEHIDSYDNFKNLISSGDVLGVNTTSFSNSRPTVNLQVGVDEKYQHFTGTSISLSANIYVNLLRTKSDGTTLRNGNEFVLHIDQNITLNGFRIIVVEDFVDPTNYTHLFEITDNDTAFIRNSIGSRQLPNEKRKGVFVTCTYDDSRHWIFNYVTDITPKGTVRMLKSALSAMFNNQGDGIQAPYWGWKIMEEMSNRFPQGVSAIANIGGEGGNRQIKLTVAQLPPHYHHVAGGSYANDGSGTGVNGSNAVSVRGDNQGSGHRYQLHGVSGGADKGRSSSVGSGSSINITPQYKRFLFIEKVV